MATILRSDLQHLNTYGIARITNVKSVSSYTWIDTPTPTIAVPGCPPLWSPPIIDHRLPKDTGLYYIAENAVRLPGSQMAPMFTALSITNPSFNVRSVDVISDRNNIRKLLSFIRPGMDGDVNEQFTIKLELVGNTLLLGRCETAVTRYIEPNSFRGYGHEFEKAYTTSQIGGSTSHYGIVSYRFCGLNFMIRYQTDGFVSTQRTDNAREALLERLEYPTPSSVNRLPPTVDPSLKEVMVLRKGHSVPLESILEIKTRAQVRSLDFNDIAPQLWVSQTTKLVRAFHAQGSFYKPQVEDVSAQLKEWELDSEEDLKMLGALIDMMIMVVKGCESCDGRGILRYDVATGSLIISRDGGNERMLPEDLYSKWDEKKWWRAPWCTWF
ncbi:hypothetical protein E4U17_004653 [Claviceps sp. LM77 group G4]|nr:hypothetical protein E4U17_004653 [Claviceps sp. LM77 group G4]KAG6077521.1 hypothetical protein E4U33_001246 [Claviceps sp. LM78 group G4]KAG6084769.1 hypothetical protein E4U16_001136 [Claviceps sp. LM84 group G4]